MKKGIHPENYRVVVFKDMSDGTQFFSRSTAATKDTIEIDGVQYPLIKLEISNTSHPFYTGKSKLLRKSYSQVILRRIIRADKHVRSYLFI